VTEPEPLDLKAICATIGRPDESAREAARRRHERLVKPIGSLGRVEELSIWLAGVQGQSPTRALRRVRLVVFAADHGIAAAGVSASPPEVTGQMLRTLLAGGAAVNALARVCGAEVRVVDLGVDADPVDTDATQDRHLPPDLSRYRFRRSGRIDVEDALSRPEAEEALRAGMALADEEVDSGADLLVIGDIGVGNTTPAAAMIGVLSRLDASEVIGRGSGIDDDAWMRKCAAIRDAMRRGRTVLADPVQLVATMGGADFAAMTGFLLQAAVRRTPVVLDGVVSAACALVAHRICFRAADWWLAGHQSTEPAHRPALQRLSLEPILSLGLRLGEGSGALLAVPLLQAAATTHAEMSTFDEAGVSEPR
jgi:nicotinate-nucleotide--dimethylbenzimidazole phosphoribosyltransferase